MNIMRTTVSINDHLLAQAKDRAQLRGVTLGTVLEDALRAEFARPELTDGPQIPVFVGTGVRSGVDLTSNRAIRELLDQGVDLDQRR